MQQLKRKLIYLFFLAIFSFTFILPAKVFAQQDYGCGTYGSGNYSEGDCATTTSTPAPGSSGSSTSSSECNATKPPDPAPTIFAALPKGGDQIEILFTRAADPYDRFILEYGTSSGYYTFGVQDIQPKSLQSYTVNYLLP